MYRLIQGASFDVIVFIISLRCKLSYRQCMRRKPDVNRSREITAW